MRERLTGTGGSGHNIRMKKIATMSLEQVQEALEGLNARLGLELPAEEMARAFRHRSYVHERASGKAPAEAPESNERLEFLGDAVIELIIREELLRRFPERSEGELTKMKSRIVRDTMLAQRAQALGLGACLLLGKGEEEEGGRARSSMLAAAFEALVGLVFLHHGYGWAHGVIVEQFEEPFAQVAEGYAQHDYKGLLQEEAHRRGARPRYSLVGTVGPAHRKEFTVQVSAAGCVEVGRGPSKKDAEQAAAKLAYEALTG